MDKERELRYFGYVLVEILDEKLFERLRDADSVDTVAIDELIRRYDNIKGEWAALSQDDGKKDREIERLNKLLIDTQTELLMETQAKENAFRNRDSVIEENEKLKNECKNLKRKWIRDRNY